MSGPRNGSGMAAGDRCANAAIEGAHQENGDSDCTAQSRQSIRSRNHLAMQLMAGDGPERRKKQSVLIVLHARLA